MPRFALIDANTFYASCERVFRADLVHKPVAVLSNNDGCIVTATREAKAAGVVRGTPAFKIAGLLRSEGVEVFSSNYELYASLSHRVMSTIASMVPAVEVYSIDECFADLTGIAESDALGRRIRATVVQNTGIPCCVGIGPTKTLAKLCNHIAKDWPAFGGVLDWETLTETRQLKALNLVSTEKVWGIGSRYAERLAAMGIYTALDLVRADPALILRRFGIVLRRTQMELSGLSCMPLSQSVPPSQQICRSRSFGATTDKATDLLSALSVHTAEAARRLRRQKFSARRVSVFFMTDVFRDDVPQHCVHESTEITATDDTRKLTRAVCALALANRRSGFAYKRAGVILSDLVPYSAAPESLFDGDACQMRSRAHSLMEALDAMDAAYGRGIVQCATAKLSSGWTMKRGHLSQCCTTRLSEILTVDMDAVYRKAA